MAKRIPREEEQVGRVSVLSTQSEPYGTVRIPLGRGRGVLSIRVGQEGDRRNAAQIYIRWSGRPGGHEISGIGYSNEYVTHALLDLETGEIYPGYQSGDPITDDILHPNRRRGDVDGEAVDEGIPLPRAAPLPAPRVGAMRGFLEWTGSAVTLAIFAYVVVLHPDRYGVVRWGALYGVGTIVALGLVYLWAWYTEDREKRERRTALRLHRERAAARLGFHMPYDWNLDLSAEPPESKSPSIPPGEIHG